MRLRLPHHDARRHFVRRRRVASRSRRADALLDARLKNGKVAVIDTGAVEELQEVLLDCAPQQNAAGYRMNNVQAGFLDATLQQHTDWKVSAPTAWRDRAAKQSGDAKLECPPLG